MKNFRLIFPHIRWLAPALAVWMAFLQVLPVSAAQSGASLKVAAIETEPFPDIHFYFEAHDEEGRFIENLQPEEIQVMEDGGNLPLDRLEKFEPGVQVITVFNTAPAFLNTAGGKSLYQKIQDTLSAWLRTQDPNELNDYSLLSNTGLLASRIANPLDFSDTLAAFKPNLLTLQPSLVSLSQALDLATDPNPSPLMKRTILYITALPPGNQVAAYAELADRAAGIGVRIQVWLVGYKDQNKTVAGQALQQLAERTGGALFLFTGTEAFPDLDEALQPLKFVYKAGYSSRIMKSGTHALAVRVKSNRLDLTSPAASFNLTVLPPNPLLITPPSLVQRKWSDPGNSKEKPRLEPDRQSLQYLVEFPDGHPRGLAYARLVVDGEVVQEVTQPPYDTFQWPLEGYTASEKHRIQIQVVDQLGLTAKTIETTVQVDVAPAPHAFLGGVVSPERLAIAAAVLLAGFILGFVLWRSAHRNHPLPARQRRQAARDPVTQPVIIQNEQPMQRSATQEINTWRRSVAPLQAPARLVRMAANEMEVIPGEMIPLSYNQITIGSNPAADLRLDDPSVSSLHARLHGTAAGDFILNDAGSIAGTWVNFNPVSSLGVQLKQGDLIHFGRVAFRFELRNPGDTPKAVVNPYQDDNLI